MFEVFPSECYVGCFCVLLYKVEHSEFQVIFIKTVTIEDDLIQCCHQLDHILANLFRFGGDEYIGDVVFVL